MSRLSPKRILHHHQKTMLFASTLIVAIASAHFISVIASNDVTVYGMNPRIPRAAPFGINIGSDNTDTVAWIAGQSQCNHVPLGPVSFLLFDQSVSLLTNALMLRLEPTHVVDLSISMMTDHSLSRVAVAILLGST
jgi:hypothetical protein